MVENMLVNTVQKQCMLPLQKSSLLLANSDAVNFSIVSGFIW